MVTTGAFLGSSVWICFDLLARELLPHCLNGHAGSGATHTPTSILRSSVRYPSEEKPDILLLTVSPWVPECHIDPQNFGQNQSEVLALT